MATIGLCMIVKNEAAVIERCLESVRRLLDYVLIADTGSTDGTQAIIRAYLARHGLAGEVIEEPWQNFAHNRTSALQELRHRHVTDYAFIMDADETLSYESDFDAASFKASLDQDFYKVEIRRRGIRYWRPQILGNGREFIYRGVLHEFIEVPPGSVSGDVAGFHIVSGEEGGARMRNPSTYIEDARTLESALRDEQDPFLRSRYTFYLAQSYRDCDETERALTAYLARSALGFWDEEVFVSLLWAARLMEALGRPPQEVLETYERAASTCPWRAEALHGASKLCFQQGRNQEGYAFAQRGTGLAFPANGLFLERWIYEYGLLDEFAIGAYWSGHYAESLDACLKLLASGSLPAADHARVVKNAQFALEKLPRDPNHGAAGAEDFFAQHVLAPQRELRSRPRHPRVLVAILAKQMEPALPLYLECLEALDYPKSSIVLYIRTNNNTDGTERLLREWVARAGHLYAHVEFDASDVPEQVQRFGLHEWNTPRLQVLKRIRNESLRRAVEHGCDFYFTADVDNFIRPCTLRELVALDLPIVAPFLRSIEPGHHYSNYHAEIDQSGYYVECDQYHWVLNRWVRGLIEMPVVHCTYLVRADVIPLLSYEDATERYDYVVFSDSARRYGVVQYLDNRQVYGYLARDDIHAHTAQARALLAHELSGRERGDGASAEPAATPDADWRRHIHAA